MKYLQKEISVGDYTFKVVVDRDITVDCFEKFPKLAEFLFSQKQSDDVNGIVVRAIKDKNLRTVFESTEQIAELVHFAFPIMLKKADNINNTDNVSRSEEIYKYILENEVDAIFNNAMFEFICQGFTPDTTEKKPKVQFTMN